jgi:hypothetical protein
MPDAGAATRSLRTAVGRVKLNGPRGLLRGGLGVLAHRANRATSGSHRARAFDVRRRRRRPVQASSAQLLAQKVSTKSAMMATIASPGATAMTSRATTAAMPASVASVLRITAGAGDTAAVAGVVPRRRSTAGIPVPRWCERLRGALGRSRPPLLEVLSRTALTAVRRSFGF